MRALISVYDKSGIAALASELHQLGVDLISSGGTAAAIAAEGIPVTDLAEWTGFPPMLGHRVVTLHPRIHGGILADRRDPTHLRDLETHHIDLIDIVVGNLYPFGSDPDAFDHTSSSSAMDLVDIGGPTLLRAAAKNHEYVTVLVDPADYPAVLGELRQGGGTSMAMRRTLARKAFAHTAGYDAQIVAWFDGQQASDDLPPTMHLSLERAQDLRYGENPHQAGARYRLGGVPSWWDEVQQHAGVDLSYLNLFDADAAWRLAHDLGSSPTCAIIKHANPCGVATADDLATAYQRALACDERSAFGGIVAFNHPVDEAAVASIEHGAQADVIIAPGYGDGVVERLEAKRKNTRVLTAPPPRQPALAVRQLSDGFLVQEAHNFSVDPENWSVVTERQPSTTELADAALAWRVCSYVSSNAIVLVKDGVAWGIGAGQQNRVESGQLAAQKAAGRAEGGVCASDAFYPFPDGVEAAAAAGVAVVVQPGGSVNDDAIIAAANELGLAMLFTGERQFRH
ncbi:MAG: bifunctional phosphoribosylaminoimidazolecarboxamide formyltransferase/IMP cyclohydrolase [Actinomycetia bacterium]|nr:bifunctional phosphoribosylaminoimidazolecarboxamide formyltransferase/IMP cyclohydrolase [Actinomycetes bacterium]